MKRRNWQLHIHPSFCLLLAFGLLILPLRWMTAWAIAIFVHEIGHYLALRLTKSNIYSIQLTAVGALMETQLLTDSHQLICTMSGPLCSLLLVVLVRWFPRLAVCGAIQAACNLLPLFPLDGGRALRSLLNMLTPRHAVRIESVISVVTMAGVFACAFFLTFVRKMGIGPVVAAGYILWKSRKALQT